jgi:phosphinothricin acetyltransferase
MKHIGRIRMAIFDDAPDILAIYQKCDHFANAISRQENISLIDVMDWLENTSDKHPILVIEHEEKLIAWCSIEPFYGLPAFDSACEISLYITPESQRKGFGTQLFQHIETQRNTFGFTHLIAYIYSSNQSSLQFFKRQGLEQWGVLPNIAKSGNLRDDVVLVGREFT